jgi:hypothetical protein
MTSGEAPAATPAAASAPVVSMCVSFGACTEVEGSAEDADALAQTCKALGGTAKRASCSQDAVLARCAIKQPAKTVAIFTYVDPKAGRDETAGMLHGAEGACEAAGGKFEETKARRSH